MSRPSAEAAAVFITRRPGETRRLAAALARLLRGDEIIHLHGGLGTGKTCFVQGLAGGLGAAGRAVSPTFTLINLYPGPVALAHVDLYRLGSPREVEGIGLEELLGRQVTAVEWAERLPDRLRGRDLEVRISRLASGARRIEVSGRGQAAAVVRHLKEEVPAQGAGTDPDLPRKIAPRLRPS